MFAAGRMATLSARAAWSAMVRWAVISIANGTVRKRSGVDIQMQDRPPQLSRPALS